MKRIEQKITEYNNTVVDLFGDDDYYPIEKLKPATEDEIKKLEQYIELSIPKELADFHRNFGGLKNIGNSESYCFELLEPSKLIQIEPGNGYGKLPSFGLIDMVVFSWGNDRKEFQNYECLSKEDTDKINTKFKCFGWYRDDTVLESAYYLYFDENGNFGTLYYD